MSEMGVDVLNHRKYIAAFIVGAVASLCSVQSAVYAQTATPSTSLETVQKKVDSAQFRDEYLRFIRGLKKDNNLTDADKEKLENTKKRIESGEEITLEYTIVRGNEGIPFPDPASITDEDFYPPTPIPEATPTPLPTSTPWQKPTRCRESKTEVEIHSPERDPKQIDWDVLFVYEDFIPLDPVEVYGSKARVHGYNPQNGKGALIRMEIYQVPCIPYRTRKTANAYYHDTGVNALKNYDTDPTGKGKLHPWVSTKLYGNKKEAPRKPKRFRKR